MNFTRKFLFAIMTIGYFLGTLFAFADTPETLIVLNEFKLPEYKKNGKLEFILYGKKAIKKGIYINLSDVLLDVIKDNVQTVREIKNMRNVKIYNIDADKNSIKKFWNYDKHSKALIKTPAAQFDTSVKILRGDKRVMLRSPSLDIDGIGFDVDYKNQKIHVRSNVKVLLRTWIERKK